MPLAGHSEKKITCFKLEMVWDWKQPWAGNSLVWTQPWSGNSLVLERALGWKQLKNSNVVELAS